MRALYKLLLTLCLFVFACNGQATTMVVINPEGNAWNSKQLQEIIKQGKVGAEHLKEAQKMVKSLEGNLKRAKGAVRDLRNMKDKIANIIPSFYRDLKDTVNPDDLLDPKWITDQLDNVFGTGYQGRREYELKEEMRANYSKRSMKGAIVHAEQSINEVQTSLEKIQDLAAQADSTQTMKDAQDVNNRLLLEILATQNKIVVLLAQLTRVEALAQYSGVSHAEGGYMGDETDSEKRKKLGEKGSIYWKRNDRFKDRSLEDL